MAKEWEPPEGHPLSVEQAKELIAGDLGNLYRSIISRCCAPIYWYYPRGEIINSGTVTFARTPRRLMAITAAHVVRGYERDHAAASRPMHLQVLNAIFNMEVIAISDDLNLATLAIDEALLPRIGKAIEPLSSWPPRVPEEGRGIMLAGYPALDRAHPKPMVVEWGLLTALCIARRVIRDQITWVAERSPDIITDLPPNHRLGGISGGPSIGWFETPGHLAHYVSVQRSSSPEVERSRGVARLAAMRNLAGRRFSATSGYHDRALRIAGSSQMRKRAKPLTARAPLQLPPDPWLHCVAPWA